jgi:glycosyltransferase involved in cell wall biosynthesis
MGLEFAHRYGRCPILFTNHTRYDLYLEAYTKLPSQVTKLIMELTWSRLARKSDAIIIPADATRNILHKFGVLEPIQVIPNGIELSKFSSPRVSLTKKDLGLPDDAIVMIFVGRMSSEKNLRVLLNEFYVANQINRRLHLLLIGDGPNFRMLKTVVQKMNLANNIQLIGEVDNDQLPAYLAASDFFVTASTSEVHSLTLLEAIAAGLPVVAISSPGTDTVVGDGKTGLLADDKPNELADKMIVMAANRSIRTQYAKNASIASKKYDIRLTISRSLSLYEELLADKRLGIRN